MKRTKPKRVKATRYDGKTLQRFWSKAMAKPAPQLPPDPYQPQERPIVGHSLKLSSQEQAQSTQTAPAPQAQETKYMDGFRRDRGW